MLKNYLITAFRNIARQKGYSLIIILGLTTSIAIFGLILLYVTGEYQTDKFNKYYNHIYRLETEEWAILGTAYGPELASSFPEIEYFTRISAFEGNSVTIRKDDKLIKLEHMLYADSSITNIFTFDFIQGNPKTALSVPFSVVLTKSEAGKLFDTEDPMGKVLRIDNKFNFTVTGIIRDVPSFHLKTNAIASFPTLKDIYNNPEFLNNYGQWNYHTFFRLKPNVNPRQLEQKIINFYTGKANWKDSKPFFMLRPLKEIYFTHVKYNIANPGGDRTMLTLFLSIGIFIVIIACVNFINLTTARASGRSKEIGVRKVLGAGKASLVYQFLGEAILITFISTELALVLMELLRPIFGNLIAKDVSPGTGSSFWMLMLALPFPVLIGIIAGSYPAIYLNRFSPISTLKKEKTSGKGSLVFRRILITFQFTISIFLIVATLTVKKQLNYFRDKKLGFDKEHIITLKINGELAKTRKLFAKSC
ncbi:MAG: FtsX-like permease family protein [Bacteroidales bacterium]|nr:FtsX-like permease family protein [Bacteroidales bacterium]